MEICLRVAVREGFSIQGVAALDGNKPSQRNDPAVGLEVLGGCWERLVLAQAEIRREPHDGPESGKRAARVLKHDTKRLTSPRLEQGTRFRCIFTHARQGCNFRAMMKTGRSAVPSVLTKSHKSRKTGTNPDQSRQRLPLAGASAPDMGSSPVESPSSLVPATAVSQPSNSSVLATDVPTELPPAKQPWHRPPDSKMRKKAEKIAVMRAAGHKAHEIARRLHTTEGTVRHIAYIARKNGWYDEDDEPVDLELELAETIDRKVVRNLSASLDGQMTNWQTHETTLAAAKGRGMFRSHDDKNGELTQLPVVAIQIVMPPLGAVDQTGVEEGSIGGVPAYMDAEVVEPVRAEDV